MSKKWILVVDSGNGGAWTLSKIRNLLPNENYLFFMDKIHAPYGNKSKKFLMKITENSLKKIFRTFDIKMIVLACNTLSSICYDDLKSKFFDTPIIRIKPILDVKYFQNQPTLVLATKCTVRHNQEIKKYKNFDNIYVKGFGTLAKKIDENIKTPDTLQGFLLKKLKRYKRKNIKNIMLGCTHYNYIKNQIQTVFDEPINFFENSDMVANEVNNVLKFSARKSRQKTMGELLILKKI